MRLKVVDLSAQLLTDRLSADIGAIPAVSLRAVPSSAISGLLFIGLDASHADDGQAEISNLVEDPVQCRLIWKRAGENGGVAQDLDLQAIEPIRPPLVQDALHPNLVESRPSCATHDGRLLSAKDLSSRSTR